MIDSYFRLNGVVEQFNYFYSFFRPVIVLLIHVAEDGDRLRVVLLDPSDNLNLVGDVIVVQDLKASKKVNLLLNGNVFKKIVPESTETLETAEDKIEVWRLF